MSTGAAVVHEAQCHWLRTFEPAAAAVQTLQTRMLRAIQHTRLVHSLPYQGHIGRHELVRLANEENFETPFPVLSGWEDRTRSREPLAAAAASRHTRHNVTPAL